MKKLILLFAICVSKFAYSQTASPIDGALQLNAPMEAAAATAPYNLTATANANGSIYLHWDGCMPENTMGFTHVYNTDSTYVGNAKYFWDFAEHYVIITGLQFGTKYYIRVKMEGFKDGISNDQFDSPFSYAISCTTVPSPTSQVPSFNKIVVVIGENTAGTTVYNSGNCPYINSVAAAGAKFTNANAGVPVSYQSQPSYLHLYAGNDFGKTTNDYISPQLDAPNLGRSVLNIGKDFAIFSEELPGVGSNVGDNGGYHRKHNPVAPFMGTGVNQVPGTMNKPLTDFPTNFNNLPAISFVVPNDCGSGHNSCGPLNNQPKQYDEWVRTHLDAYKQWCKANNSLLIITYDEDDNSHGNNIALALYGAWVLTGVYSQYADLDALCRMMCESVNCVKPGAAATAATMYYCWQTTQATVPIQK